MSKLIDEVVMIAGRNAIASNDEDIRRLAKTINYLHKQILISTKGAQSEEMIEASVHEVFDNAAGFLKDYK